MAIRGDYDTREQTNEYGSFDLGREAPETPLAPAAPQDVKIGLSTLLGLTGQITLMLKTGTSLIDCLDALIEQTEDEGVESVLEAVKRDISGGNTLAHALSKHPRAFDSFYVSTVRVGEATGTLPAVFARIEEHLQKSLDIRNSIITSMIYPAIVTSLSFSAILFIMTWVLPRFIIIFERNRVELPLPTKFLMGLSGFLVTNWMYLAVGAVALIGAGWWFASLRLGGGIWDRIFFSLPMTRNLVRSLQTSFMFRTVGTQLATGVPLLESLEVARDACKSPHFRTLLDNTILSITQGEDLTSCMRRSELLEPAVKQMIATGEQTGALAPIMLSVADHLDKRADKQLKRLTAILEPILLLGMGVMIGFIAVATLFPLFKLTSAVRGG